MPVNGVAGPQAVVAFNVTGPHGPPLGCPCHSMVIVLVPCPLIMVPMLAKGAAIDHVMGSPDGNVPPVNVYVPVPSTHTLVGPEILPTVACVTVKVTGTDGQGGKPFACSTTVIVPGSVVQIIVAELPVELARLPGWNVPTPPVMDQ